MKWAKSRVRKSASRAMDVSRDKNQTVTISVILLDHTPAEFHIGKREHGQVLLDQVFQRVKCKEPKYYGLQFPQDVPDCMKWLDPDKSIRKQFKRGYPLLLYYRIKYFIFDINQIKDHSTRYELFLQVKYEILERRLICPPGVAPVLAAYALQSEVGDFDPSKHNDDYVTNFKFLPNQTKDFEIQVKKLHQKHKGLEPTQAEFLFLQEAKRIKRYGVEIHQGKDLDGNDIEIGVATDGMGLFRNRELRHKYEWAKIVKISFKRKQFFIQLQKDRVKDNAVPIIEFSMENYRACKRLWKNCVDCHSFYRKEKERLYRKHGNNGHVKPDKPIFGFFSVGGKNKSKYDKAEREILRFRNPPKSSSSKMLNSNAINDIEDNVKEVRRLSAPPSVTLAVLPDDADYSSDHDSPTSFTKKRSFQNRNSMSNEPSLDSEAISEPNDGSYSDSAFQQQYPLADASQKVHEQIVLPDDINLVRLKPDEQGKFGFNIKGGVDQNMPITISKIAAGSPADLCEPSLSIGDEIIQINGRDANTLSHEEVVNFIRNTRERFAGELVLLAKPFTVQSYDEAEYAAEVPVPVPQIIENGPIMPREEEISLNGLEYSMTLLEDQLEQGRDVKLFDKLERRNPNLTMKDAKLPNNLSKNRYRDISPYDVTRVKLTNWETDYINGNHILMEIPDTNIRNHYIACQGPLPNTCGDFWAMVYEQKATLIVMVTTTIERGMMKCFQYWPSKGNSVKFGNITVTSICEETTSCFVFRDFEIDVADSDDETTKRHVSHIQYVAWPDHGVPDDASDFLYFISCVREKRVGMTVPTIVHCSAGIGRTGVMIAVETAMCLIESNKPVFPLKITRCMRNQRAMMIQTPMQFRFVCEAILKLYKDGISEAEQLAISDCDE